MQTIADYLISHTKRDGMGVLYSFYYEFGMVAVISMEMNNTYFAK